MAEDRWLIAGLGNPGPQYAGNRHNVGFMCCDVLAAEAGTNFKRDRSRAMAASVRVSGVPAVLAKPNSFMNLSGRPVAALRTFYKIPAERIVVVHDELDLAFGAVRLKTRRRRQRAQRPAFDYLGPGHQGLLPDQDRHRAAAGSDGPCRFRIA